MLNYPINLTYPFQYGKPGFYVRPQPLSAVSGGNQPYPFHPIARNRDNILSQTIQSVLIFGIIPITLAFPTLLP